MTVAAATSLAAETNQRPSREIRSSTPLLRTGLHTEHAHHTEPRKTCSRVRGICNSAIMKHEFVQPCAGQNSEFTSPPSPKKHVPVRQEQEKKKELEKKKKKKKKKKKRKKEGRRRRRRRIRRRKRRSKRRRRRRHRIIKNTQNHQKVSQG